MDTQGMEDLDNNLTEEELAYRALLEKAFVFWLFKLSKDNENITWTERKKNILLVVIDAILKDIQPEKRSIEEVTLPDKRINYKRVNSRLFNKKLDAYSQGEVSNMLARVFRYAVEYLNWKSASDIEVKVVQNRVIPHVRETEMYNAHYQKYYTQILDDALFDFNETDGQKLFAWTVLSLISDSHVFNRNELNAILRSSSAEVFQLGDNEPRLLITNQEQRMSKKLHLRSWLFLLKFWNNGGLESLFLNIDDYDLKQISDRCLLREIKRFSKKFNINLLIPRQMGQIIDVVAANIYLKRPSMLHAVSIGKKPFTELKPETLYRIITGNRVLHKRVNSDVNENPKIDSEIDDLNDGEDSDASQLIAPQSLQEKRIRQIRKVLRSIGKKDSVTFLENTIKQDHQSSLMVLWLMKWLLSLYRRAQGNELSDESIKRYFYRLAYLLIAAFDNLNLLELEEEDWIDLLQEVIDNSNDKQVGIYLKYYINYLNKNMGLMELPLHELDGIDFNGSVNANVLTPFEAVKVYHALSEDDVYEKTTITCRQIALILGYFCGLRRREVWKLRTIDIYGRDDALFLFVRSHKARKLKNFYSRRRIPLAQLIPRFLLKHVVAWWKVRKQSNGVYFISDSPSEPANEKDIFDSVQMACRKITGDHTFVFHGLRHSFANYFMIKVMQVPYPELARLFGCKKILQDAEEVRELQEFYSKGASADLISYFFPRENQTLPRSTLMQLAMLLGHKVPDTTFKSYLHIFQEIVPEFYEPLSQAQHAFLFKSFFVTSQDSSVKASRIKKSYLNEDKSFNEQYIKTKIVCDLISCHEIPVPGFQESEDLELITNNGIESKSSSIDEEIIRVLPKAQNLLQSLMQNSIGVEELSKIYGVSRELIEYIHNKAIYVSKLQSLKGQKRFPHVPLISQDKSERLSLEKHLKRLAFKATIDIEKMRPGLELFLSKAQTNKGYLVRLNSVAEVNCYLSMLQELRVPFRKMQVSIEPPKKGGIKEGYSHEQMQCYWASVIKPFMPRGYIPSAKFLAEIHSSNPYGVISLRFYQNSEKPAPEFQKLIFIFALFFAVKVSK